MSVVSAMRARPTRRGQAGFTLIEVSVSLALLVIMAIIVERTLDSTNKAERYLSAVRKVTERGHKLTYEVRELVTASRRLFFNNDEGKAYLGVLDLSATPVRAGARMPLVDELGRLGPDAEGDPRTGNILFFVGETDATPAIADPDGPVIRYVDTYRFICCFPQVSNRRVVVPDAAAANAVDLVVWQSLEFPSYKQLMAIADPTERTNVVADLVQRFGVTMAWDSTAPAVSAFYGLSGTGTIAALANPAPLIEEDPEQSQGGRLVYANVQLSMTDPDDAHRRAVFTSDPPSQWAPDGFEVKVVGSSGSRKVWMHLVVEVQADRGRVAVQPCTIITSVRDL
jgi:prepilin-type N-terminal cleavage/methylation domain-containing protein